MAYADARLAGRSRVARKGPVEGSKTFRLAPHVGIAAILLLTGLRVALLSEPAAAVYTAFGPNVLVDDSAALVQAPDIAVDASGILHVVWADRRAGPADDDVYYSRSTDSGVSWSVSVRIDNTGASRRAFDPSIAVSTGTPSRVYVVWKEQPVIGHEIMSVTSADGGLTWNPAVRVDSGAPASTYMNDPVVAVDSGGKAYTAWEDRRNTTDPYQIWGAASIDQGASWGTNYQISATDWVTNGEIVDEPSITTLGPNLVAVAWDVEGTNSGLWGILVGNSADAGANWTRTTVRSVATSAGTLMTSDITSSAGNVLFLTWRETTNAGATGIWFSRSDDQGGTWTAAVRIDDTPPVFNANPVDPKIALLGGLPYVVWADQRTLDYGIYSSGSDDGGITWGDGITDNYNDSRVDDDVFAAHQASPALAGESFGLYAVWRDTRNSATTYDIYFSASFVSKIQITEFRDSPDGSGEVVELTVYGARDIDMTGYHLVTDVTNSYDLSPLGVIPRGEYRTIGNWPSASLQPPAFRLGVTGDEGGSIELRDASDVLLDSVSFGQKGVAPDPGDDPAASVARHWTGERYDECWAVDLAHTLGGVNDGGGCAIPPSVLINEVYYDAPPGNGTDRFIELVYMGNGTLDTATLRLVGDTVYDISVSVLLSPSNRFSVIRYGDGPALFDALSPAGDNLYLYEAATGDLLDEVGWSTVHPAGSSVCRSPPGAGTSTGFDDFSSMASGWAFDCLPSAALVTIGPPQSAFADLGETITFSLTVRNKQTSADYIDILNASAPGGWSVFTSDSSGLLPLGDHNGNGFPDTDLLAAGGSINISIQVFVPAAPPSAPLEWVNITAQASAWPIARDTAPLIVRLYPYLHPDRSLDPAVVNVEGSGGTEVATVTLSVTGMGAPYPVPVPQDVVLMTDSSGSMGGNDPNNDRLAAAMAYIDLLSPPDRVSILDFDSICRWTGPDHHLTTPGHDGNPDYQDPKADVIQIDSAGGTNLLCPIQNAVSELTALGNPTHSWVGILLTDGMDTSGNTSAAILAAADNASSNGIVLFTIGLGLGVDGALLTAIAQRTGGMYYPPPPNPADLVDIYLDIHEQVSNRAGADPYADHGLPMVEEHVPPYINVIAGSFVAPPGSIETNPDPDWWSGGIMRWNVSSIYIGESWVVSYNVTCRLIGTHPVALFPESRVAYLNYAGGLVITPFPERLITCVGNQPASPPRQATATMSGGYVTLAWAPDPSAPDHHLIYRALGSPRGFTDLNPAAAYASVPGALTSWTDPVPIAVPGETYYLMRSANLAETDLSATSETVGVFSGSLRVGLTAISRPLEYFPTVDYSGAEPDTIEEYRVDFGATAISYLDGTGAWRRVPGTGDPALHVPVGLGLLVETASGGMFSFTGLPASMLVHDESTFAGFLLSSPETSSLDATTFGDDVILTFDQPPAMGDGGDTYEIYFATTRTGFFDGSAQLLTGSPIPAPPWPQVMVTHGGALLLSPELYYLVVPVDSVLGAGSSTFSLGVSTRVLAGTTFVGLPLRPQAGSVSASQIAAGIPLALGVLWLDNSGTWVVHFSEMPVGVFDSLFSMGAAFQLAVRTPVRHSFVGG